MASYSRDARDGANFIHFFSQRSRGIGEAFARVSQKIPMVSWQKKSSGIKSTITEDVVRAVALPLRLVDVKVCAIDHVWSDLKLVLQRENR